MTHLILGGTGTVGSMVTQYLLQKGQSARVVSRSADKLKHLPEGATGVVGDLGDPSTYGRIFRDYETVFLLNAVVPTELQEGLAAVNEARRSGARRIVYISVQNVEKGPHIPHFASKIAIEQAIRKSGIPYTILRPNNFYQNDYWFKDVLLQYGVYPQPLGDLGLSRVDVRDIAEAAVNALTQDKYRNQTYTLAGPDCLSGADCAAAFGKALGKKIGYAGNDLEAWGRQAGQMLPGWLVYDLKLMYEFFQKEGLCATPAQRKETEAILGHPPRRYADFVKETAAMWG